MLKKMHLKYVVGWCGAPMGKYFYEFVSGNIMCTFIQPVLFFVNGSLLSYHL